MLDYVYDVLMLGHKYSNESGVEKLKTNFLPKHVHSCCILHGLRGCAI